MVLRTRVFTRFYALHIVCLKLFKVPGKNSRWKEALADVLGIKWVTTSKLPGCGGALLLRCSYVLCLVVNIL